MRKWWKDVLSLKNRPHAKRNAPHRTLRFENLEDRRVLATALTPVQPLFIQEGPSPIVNPAATTSNSLPKSTAGAVQAIAIDSNVNDGSTVFAGTVNGGIFETTDYYNTGAGPTWTAITNQDNIITTTSGTAAGTTSTPTSGLDGSLSISALATDNGNSLPGGLTAGSVLVAATGNYSDVGLNGTGPVGGPLTGVWEDLSAGATTINANPTWYQVAGIPTGKNYAAVAVGTDSTLSGTTTEYIMAADNGNVQYSNPSLVNGLPTGGLYESTMTYANGVPTYTSFEPSTPLPVGAVTDVIEDPSTPGTYYAAVLGANAGIYRSMATNDINGQTVSNGQDGNTWVEIASLTDMPELSGAWNIQLAAGKNNTLYVGIVGSNFQLDNIYVSTNDNANLAPTQAINQGVTFTALGTPTTADGGINAYSLGAINFAIAVNPNTSTQIYVGGDFAPPSSSTGTWPNSIGSAEDTGTVFSATVTGTGATATAAWSPIVADYAQDTSPPGGTRTLVVATEGSSDLLEGSDGGIYDRTSPTGSGAWVSHNGLVPTTTTTPSDGLSATEFYSVAYDPVSNSLIGGTQDLGIVEQEATGADVWNQVSASNPSETNSPTSYYTTVSPVGISGGQVAVADVGGNGATLYASNDYFNDFFSQPLNSSIMTTPPATTTPTMLVDGSGGQTLYQVEDNLGTGSTFSFETPIATDAVSGGLATPNKSIVVGSEYVYESFDGGNTWTAIDGLSGTGSSAQPLDGLGQVTALAYGGTYDNVADPYVLWAGSNAPALYLRVEETFTTGDGGTYQNPVNTLIQQTGYGGGTPVGIVMNPTNWTNTYVADGSNVYLASVPFNGTTTTGSTTFTSLGGPGGGFKISGVTFVPDVGTYTSGNTSVQEDAIVVSGWNSGSATNTGVYELTVNDVTGAIIPGATWNMVGAPSDGVQTGITGQEQQLPHVPVTAITYNQTNDVLVVTTEGAGVWELPSFAKSNTGYVMSITGAGSGGVANVSLVASTTEPGYFYVLMNGVQDSLTINGKTSSWPINLSLIQQTNVATTAATTNNLDLDFNSTYSGTVLTPAATPVDPIPSGRFVDANSTGSTVSVEDDTATISISGSAGSGTLSLSNSPTAINFTNALTNASLTGGSTTNTTFTFTNWSVPATVNGAGGADTLSYTSNQTVGTSFTLTNAALNQAVTSGTAPGTLAISSIITADITGGSGNNNFDITQWTGGGSIVGGTGTTSIANAITDYTTTTGSYIYFSSSAISVGMPGDPTEYRPLIALSNLQTINLSGPSGTRNINFSDQGWLGTVNLTGVAGMGNAVLISSLTSNTTFTLSDSQILTTIISGGAPAITSTVYTTDVQDFNVFGGPGNNVYNVSNFNLNAFIGAGGTGNTIQATENANFTVSNTGMTVGSNGADGNFVFSAGPDWGLDIDTEAASHTVTVSSFLGTGTLSAGNGSDAFILGGNSTTGDLDGLGTFTIEGGTAGSTLALYDESAGAGYNNGLWYDMGLSSLPSGYTSLPSGYQSVTTDIETPRAWGGVLYDSHVDNVSLYGAANTASTKFLVGPSTTAHLLVYGESPNNFVGTLFYGTPAQVLTLGLNGQMVTNPSQSQIDASSGIQKTGYWTFYVAPNPKIYLAVSFSGINTLNGVTPLVVGGGTSLSTASEPIVRVYDGSTGDPVDVTNPVAGVPNGFLAYPSTFTGGVQLAVTQFATASQDDTAPYDIVTAPGPGTPGLVEVWTETGTLVTSFYPFGSNYTGGINVAVGDVTGDGIPDIVVGEQSGGTQVAVFNGASLDTASPNLTLVGSFAAYASNFTGGVSVAVGAMTSGSPYGDIITVPYSAGPAKVHVFSGAAFMSGGAEVDLEQYYALPASYTLGATVAVGDINGGAGEMDIIVAAGINGNSEVVVTNGASVMSGAANPTAISTFYAYPTPGASTPTQTSTSEAPVHITLKDILGDGRDEVFISQGTGGSPNGGINIMWQFGTTATAGYSAQLLAALTVSSSQGGLILG